MFSVRSEKVGFNSRTLWSSLRESVHSISDGSADEDLDCSRSSVSGTRNVGDEHSCSCFIGEDSCSISIAASMLSSTDGSLTGVCVL